MASGFKFNNQDFDLVFEPLTTSPSSTTTNYATSGVDIVSFYEPLSRDQQIPDIGYYYGSVPITELLMGNEAQFPKTTKETTSIDIGWNVKVDYYLDVMFSSVQSMNDYFKYGGRIILKADILGTPSTTRDIAWRDLLRNDVGTIEFGNTNTYQNYDQTISSYGLQNITTNWRRIAYITKNDGTDIIEYKVYAKKDTNNNSKINFHIIFDNDLPRTTNINPTNYIVNGTTSVYAIERRYPTMESPQFSGTINPEKIYSNFVYKLYPSNPVTGGGFGIGKAISKNGQTIVIGSFTRYSQTGGVYVFKRKPNGLFGPTEDQFIPRPSGVYDKQFGIGVIISGDGKTFLTKTSKYYVFAYRLNQSTGNFDLYQTFYNPEKWNGISVNYDGTVIAIGSPDTDSGYGKVYLYKDDQISNQFILEKTFSRNDQHNCPDTWWSVGDRCPLSSSSNPTLDNKFIGPTNAGLGGSYGTKIHHFEYDDSIGDYVCFDTTFPYSSSTITPVFYGFGGFYSEDGNVFTCSDPWATVQGHAEAGIGYFYKRNATTGKYDLIDIKISPNPMTGGRFGFTRITNDYQWMIIGEPGANKAYVYKYDSTLNNYVINETLTPYDNNWGRFGRGDLDDNGKTFIVSMPENDYTYNGTYIKDSGCVYVFNR